MKKVLVFILGISVLALAACGGSAKKAAPVTLPTGEGGCDQYYSQFNQCGQEVQPDTTFDGGLVPARCACPVNTTPKGQDTQSVGGPYNVCVCGTREVDPTVAPATRPTAVPPTEIPATAAPPTVAPSHARIIPCIDGSQDSCVLYAMCAVEFSKRVDPAQTACICTYLSDNYTVDEFMAADTDRLAGEINSVCGPQSGT